MVQNLGPVNTNVERGSIRQKPAQLNGQAQQARMNRHDWEQGAHEMGREIGRKPGQEQGQKRQGREEDAQGAQAVIDEAVEALIGWNLRNIDEITRITRDYEIDFELFQVYRLKIAEEILRLRKGTKE